MDILARALSDDDFAVSAQVLAECANVLFKKGGMNAQMVSKCIWYLQQMENVVPVTVQLVNSAIEIKALYGLQFYDSLIIAAAEGPSVLKFGRRILETDKSTAAYAP